MALVWKNRVTDLLSVSTIVGFDVFPTECVQIQEMPCILPKILSSKMTS